MYELVQVGNNTYYIDCPTKIGIYKLNDNDVCLIDTGNDKECGRKINKILKENNWNLKTIINTHSNADHIGGNSFLQNKYNCEIISTPIENTFASHPTLESSFLYGGYPCKKLRNKFLMAKQSNPTGNVEDNLPDGLEYIDLPGHYFQMIGIKTDDDVYFLADCIFGENIIKKYHLFVIYDVREYLNTLDKVMNLDAKLFIPSHADAVSDIRPLAQLNIDKVHEICDTIYKICKEPLIFEDILQRVFDFYNLNMDFNQYVLIGSTVRSFLSYLYDEGKADIEIVNNKLLWKSIDE